MNVCGRKPNGIEDLAAAYKHVTSCSLFLYRAHGRKKKISDSVLRTISGLRSLVFSTGTNVILTQSKCICTSPTQSAAKRMILQLGKLCNSVMLLGSVRRFSSVMETAWSLNTSSNWGWWEFVFGHKPKNWMNANCNLVTSQIVIFWTGSWYRFPLI